MLPIHKNTVEPLRQHRSQPNATYGNIPDSDRKNLVCSLLHEQGHLCAYCMCRIKAPLVKVDHWKCRDRFPELQLEYSNLLAVCCGNSGKNSSLERCENERGVTEEYQHCDTKKGNNNLKYNPSDTEHHSRLQIDYVETTGLISSTDKKFNEELSVVLNLNIAHLKTNRLHVLQGIKDGLAILKRSAKKAELAALLRDWRCRNADGKFKEFSGVAIWYLENRVRSAQ